MKTVTMRNCRRCGSANVRKLASVYAPGMSEAANISTHVRGSGAIAAHPPQNMPSWKGWTFSMLVWPPIGWLFLFIAVQPSAAGERWQAVAATVAAFLTAVIVGVAAWSIPTLLQQRWARRHSHKLWPQRVKDWQEASVCLNCCQVHE